MSRLLLSALIFGIADAAHAKPTVSFVNDANGRPVQMAVKDLDDATLSGCSMRNVKQNPWDEAIRIQIVPENRTDDITQVPALLGEWSVKDKTLLFEPRFPFAAGTNYRLSVDPTRLENPHAKPGADLTYDLQTPRKELKPVTKLAQIYPTSSALPENHLRFYLHFSRPMSRGEAYDNIRLLDANGKELNDVFLELGEELWDPQLTRFSLLFHPGRVKNGLKPREELGPILENGKKYTLVVSGKWRDAEGKQLVDKEYRKEFTADPAADEPVDQKKWKLTAPKAQTSNALVVRFPAPLDRALLERVVWVVDEKNRKVAGKVSIAEDEKVWSFTPEKAWENGTYRLVAETILEDLAANRIGRKFEVDVFEPIPKTNETKTVELPFDVK